jgi:hypothetical protein
MGRTFIRQDAQIAESFTYDDTVTPSLANYETNPANIENDLNNLRSQLQNFLNRSGAGFPSGNWYDDLTAPSTLEAGTQRGIDAVNDALHAVEKKRVLRDVYDPGNDVTVTAAQNFQILALAELPTNTTAAVGSVTTLGTVAAYDSVFTGNTLDEVSGTNALNPKNLCNITDASTGDPILSSGRVIYALFQTETATDGHTMTGTTPFRAKLSFVRPNATFDDLEACPAGDIATKVINYSTRERVRLEDLTEQDFLKGAVVDVPAGSTPTRQTVYDNQGTTPVDVTTNSTLDLEGAGLTWTIRDDLEANLFVITEGSAGGTSSVQIASDVDTFDVDAAANDFLNGASFDTGAAGTTIDIGVTAANEINSGGALAIRAGGSSDLTLDGNGGEVLLDDANFSAEATWTQAGVKVTETTTEITTYESNFGGEVSLFNAINQAYSRSSRVKGYATVTADVAADTDVANTTAGNLDVDLPDYSGVGTFVDDVDVYLNGELLRNGADAAANHDVYPGTTPSVGMLKFEFALKGTGSKPDQLCMIVWSS